MNRVSIFMLVSCLALFARTQTSTPSAVVHLKLLVAPTGDDLDDLGSAKVSFFKSEADGRDYANQFQDNIASRIPYGVYRLRVYQDGFYSAERQVVVKQPVVWVVIGLEIGAIGSDGRNFELAGTIRNMAASGQQVWIRLTGVHSSLLRDAKVDDSGNFLIAGLRQDKAVLTVWSGTQILHVRPVTIPSDKPLLIDLGQKAGMPGGVAHPLV